jgi:hypothetical protein
MDILGKWLATVGVCAILLIDEASGFAEVYGINNKNDLVDALSRYCQGVVARDMQPHFGDLMLGQKSLGTESLQAFRSSLSGQTSSQSYHQHRESEDQPGGEDGRIHAQQHVPAAGEPHQAAMVGSIVCSSGRIDLAMGQ